MSYPDMLSPWNGQPEPGGPPLRELILAGLAEAAITRLVILQLCDHCTPAGFCSGEHEQVAGEADRFGDAYTMVAAGSPGWADLALALAAGMN